MRIQGPKTPDVTELKTARQTSSAEKAPATGSGGDVVKLSDHGHDVATTSREYDAAQAARVAHIRAAVERGDYRIDFDQLTEAILADEVARFQK